MTFLEELDDDLLELCTGGFGGSYGDSGGGGGDFGGFGGGDFGGFGGGDSGGFGDFGSGGDFGLGDFGLGGDFGFGLGDTGLGIGGDSGDVSLGEVGADLGGDAPASDIGGDTAVEASGVEASGDPVGEPASSSEPTADLSVSADAGPDADAQGPEAFAEPVDTNADPNGAAAQQESVEPAMPDAMSDEPAIVVSESAETAEADAAEVTAQEVVMADAPAEPVSDPPVTTDPQTPDDPMFANEDHAPVTQREPDVVGPEGLEAAPPNDAAPPTDVDPAPHVTDGVLPHFGQTGAGPEVSANSPQTSGEPPKPVEPPLPLTPEEQYEVDVYKTQNPVDVLEQGNVGDCYAVAVLRELGDTPEGRAYMDSLVQDLGDGFYQVTLVGPDGQAQVQTVWLHEGEKFGNGDPKVMALEKAIVYNQQSASGIEGMNGGQVTDAMNQLGLQNPTYGPPSDALNVGIQNQVITVQTGDVGPLPYGLVSNHAYTVVGTAVDPSGTLMVLLSNPWGDGHPLPIPADLLGTAVTGATTGQIVWPDP